MPKYTWMLQQQIVQWEDQEGWNLSEKKIRDQSKADNTTKLITLIQVSWFVAQSIMRTVDGLPLSQLESMTLSYIPLFTITYFFWWYKPKDILTHEQFEKKRISTSRGPTPQAAQGNSSFSLGPWFVPVKDMACVLPLRGIFRGSSPHIME
jgi:hypothetical protein